MADDTMCSVDMEVSLFHAMRRHKPVGVNRYFQMMYIHERLNNAGNRKISSKQIWQHLSEMYDLQALNESEITPFPNKLVDFVLPDSDYKDLMEKPYPRMDSTSAACDDSKASKSESRGILSSDRRSDSKLLSKSDNKGSTTPHAKDIRSDKGTTTPHGKDGRGEKGTTTPHGKETKSESRLSKDSKSESKGLSTPHSKDIKGESKGSATPQGGKGGKSTSQSSAVSATNTPESTPKRKRTRQTNSANASPATPSEVQSTKRVRR